MRKCGILLSISSLPSAYGIGTLGRGAFEFVDFLKKAGQTFWQVLPISTISFGNSPYQGFSAFAFNQYYIDPDELIADGLLKSEDLTEFCLSDSDRVDYSLLYKSRNNLLKRAARRFDKACEDYQKFCLDNFFWLEDYAVFMAYKEKHEMQPLCDLPEKFKRRDKHLIENFREEESALIDFYKITQYLFWCQWIKLRKYANDNGVQIIGDIPIYVSNDSSDVWAGPELFSVDKELKTVLAAGCPPDEFSKTGQLWGNPVYKWENHEKTEFDFWLKRLRQANSLFDVTRIDHFRGFFSYYAVPSGDKTAENGKWYNAPGEGLVEKLKTEIPEMKIIAEDLGFITPEIRERMDKSGFPGMKIIQFGFDSDSRNEHLPHNFEKNTVAYTGTHDNMTSVGWMLSSDEKSRSFAMDYFGVSFLPQLPEAMIRGALSSVSDTAVIPIQDYLRQGNDSRMNTPSTTGENNWTYRINKTCLNDKLAHKLRGLAELYGRL